MEGNSTWQAECNTALIILAMLKIPKEAKNEIIYLVFWF